MGWIIVGYVACMVITAFVWAIYNENRYHGQKSMNFIFASMALWPLHVLWTILRGLPEVFHIKRRPVTLTRKQQQDILYRQERNKTEAEWQRLTGTPALPLE